jgi:hypothetical protein
MIVLWLVAALLLLAAGVWYIRCMLWPYLRDHEEAHHLATDDDFANGMMKYGVLPILWLLATFAAISHFLLLV